MTQAEIIKEARIKLPEPEKISTKYFVTPVFDGDAWQSLDVFRLVQFEKVSENGILKWKFNSIT